MATVNDELKRVRWWCPVTERRRSRSFATLPAAQAFALKCERENVLERECDVRELSRQIADLGLLYAHLIGEIADRDGVLLLAAVERLESGGGGGERHRRALPIVADGVGRFFDRAANLVHHLGRFVLGFHDDL